MGTGQMVIRLLRTLATLHDGAGLSDGQLLERFISRGDSAALAALVRRHGPMVWGVCRRVLRNYHDAEDAFQATFLVLVRRAASIASPELLANWLYGVAHQTALKARATTAKRRARERQMTQMPEPVVTEQDLWHELRPLLDKELSRLPDKYRVAIVLCDLEGKTRKEAARQLGVPDGTLAARLARGRVLLAKRIVRQGVAVSGGSLAAVVAQNAAVACVPAAVVSSTIHAASLLAAGKAAAAGVTALKGVTAVNAAALTGGVVKTMFLTKLKLITGLLLLLGCGGGAALFAYRAAAGDGTQPQVAAQDTKAIGSGAVVLQPSAILKKAREAADAIDDKPHKARTLQAIAEAQLKAGDKPAAARAFQDAIQIAKELPDEAKDRILTSIAGAQARAGDFKGARETAARVTDERFRDYVGGLLGAAQAAAGDIKGALQAADEVSSSQRVNVLRAVARAQAEAGKGQDAAQTAAMLLDDYDRALTLLSVATAHLKAKDRDAARKSAQQAQQIVQGFPEGSDAKCMAYQYVAEAQAALGDLKDARQTAEAIANDTVKNMALGKIVAVQAKAGDVKGAVQTAEALQDEKQKRDVLVYYILPAQLRSGDVTAAQQTAEALKGDHRYVLALGEIAKAQTHAGHRTAAAKTFNEAFEVARQLADEQPAEGEFTTRNVALCRIVGHQAEAGEEQTAFDWALKQSSPLIRANALLIIAQGMTLRKEAEKRPRE